MKGKNDGMMLKKKKSAEKTGEQMHPLLVSGYHGPRQDTSPSTSWGP